jgi:hypothetical protein
MPSDIAGIYLQVHQMLLARSPKVTIPCPLLAYHSEKNSNRQNNRKLITDTSSYCRKKNNKKYITSTNWQWILTRKIARHYLNDDSANVSHF